MFLKFRKPQDIYDTLVPVFFAAKVVGTAPYKFENIPKRRFVAHFGIITLVRFIIFIGFAIYTKTMLDDEQKFIRNMRWFSMECELFCGTFMTVTLLICAVTNQQLVIKAVENMVNVDAKMKEAKITVSYKNAQKFAFFQIIGITFVFLLKATLQPLNTKSQYMLAYNVFNVVDYINTNVLFQYINMLLLLRQRYIWLNRHIRNLVKINESESGCPNGNMQNITSIRVEKSIPLKQPASSNNTINSTGTQIIVLAKIHEDLYNIAKLVNRSFAVQLLVTIAARFIMITAQLINTYNIIKDPSQGGIITYAVIAIYLFLHISKIFMVASISENTAAKANASGHCLHKLWYDNSELHDKIQQFSLQILHNKLKFTACGFFVLDYGLIYSIIGAVSTYLIIMIQFDLNKRTN